MKKIVIDNWKFYKYNPNSEGEKIAEVYYENKDYKIKILAVTCKETEPECPIKYICEYSHGNKKFNRNIFDTYKGTDRDKIITELKGCIEFCYNKHRKGRNVKLF